jgi:hypothetical protein
MFELLEKNHVSENMVCKPNLSRIFSKKKFSTLQKMTSTETSLEIACVVLASVIILIIILWWWFRYRKTLSYVQSQASRDKWAGYKNMQDYGSLGSSYWDEDPNQNNIPDYMAAVDHNNPDSVANYETETYED